VNELRHNGLLGTEEGKDSADWHQSMLVKIPVIRDNRSKRSKKLLSIYWGGLRSMTEDFLEVCLI